MDDQGFIKEEARSKEEKEESKSKSMEPNFSQSCFKNPGEPLENVVGPKEKSKNEVIFSTMKVNSLFLLLNSTFFDISFFIFQS